MTYLLLGLAVLLAALLLLYQFRNVNPGSLARVLRWTLIGAGIALVAFFAATGRLAAALPLLLAVPFLFMRLKRAGVLGTAGPAGGPGQASKVETPTLRMTLDHASGTMSGTVLRGPYTGRDLGSLGEDELADVYAHCVRDDAEAARVLEAYLDRSPYAATWRDHVARQGGGTADQGRMTRDEACRVLGVEADASPDAIREAHRRLMMANHPDHGGSTYLAAKINEAKEILLGQAS